MGWWFVCVSWCAQPRRGAHQVCILDWGCSPPGTPLPRALAHSLPSPDWGLSCKVVPRRAAGSQTRAAQCQLSGQLSGQNQQFPPCSLPCEPPGPPPWEGVPYLATWLGGAWERALPCPLNVALKGLTSQTAPLHSTQGRLRTHCCQDPSSAAASCSAPCSIARRTEGRPKAKHILSLVFRAFQMRSLLTRRTSICLEGVIGKCCGIIFA